MSNSFWDLNQDGKLDTGEIMRAIFMGLCYAGGIVLMLTTIPRNYHLLSSPQMMPGDMAWWAWVTALTPEFGLVISWLATEVGFRKGQLPLTIVGVTGALLFVSIIATMAVYDVAYINGSDISTAATWGHFVASVLPLFTIVYLIICNSLGAAMARTEKIRGGGQWREQPRKTHFNPQQRLPVVTEDLGEPLTDPLSSPRAKHPQARKSALAQLERIQSVGSNGADPEDFS